MSFLLEIDGPIYVIRRKDHPYFLYSKLEYPSDIDVVAWTRMLFQAQEFYSEETVETFLYTHLRNRPCEIIMAK